MDESTREEFLGGSEGEGHAQKHNRKRAKPDTQAKLISMAVLALVLITVWYMLDLVLLTFVTGFIFYNLLMGLHKITNNALKGKVPDSVLLVLMYALLVLVLTLASIHFAPKLTAQITAIADMFQKFDFDAFRQSLDPALAGVLVNFDITPYIAEAGRVLMGGAGRFGAFGVNLLLSLLLSLFLLMEKDEIRHFGGVMGKSKISFLYDYFLNFSVNFTRSFGNVMKVQVTIAFINCILSMIMLTILGFPQILGLGIMIFFMGLIPVAGVIISLIPLSVIAFSIGGIPKVLAVLVMVALIHALEAYVMNPKLMSDKTSLPVSFVFVILVVAEHYLKVWGLLIGVPLFIFLMDLFEVDYKHKRVAKPEKNFLAKLLANRRKNARHAKRRRHGGF